MSFLSEDIRQKILAELPKYPTKRAVTLPALHHVQDALRCVPLEAIKEIAEILELHPAEVHDTMSFYGFFRDEQHKLGKTRLWVCRGLACMLRGGDEIYKNVSKELGIGHRQCTPDGKFSLEEVECMGACGGAPMIAVNEDFCENISPARVGDILQGLK